MTTKKRPYYLVLKFSLIISSLMAGLLALIFHYWFENINLAYQSLLFVFSFIVSFFLLNIGIKSVIHKSIKQIYNHIIGVNSSSKNSDFSDLSDLTKKLKIFATKRKHEIETLRSRDNYRKEFIGNLSHEMKTPLFTIQGYVETLLDGAMEDKEKLRQYLRRTSKGVERLTYIINDLDLITKLETDTMSFDYTIFDLVELIKGVFELLEITANKKQITLTFHNPYESIKVYAHKESMQQVITNLIVNSIKYGKIKGTTEIIIIEDTTSDTLRVCVSDNGEGIDKPYINRVFERFFRVEKSRSRVEGGSGLGLAIVKHLIEAHNQTIEVNSVLGVGTEFCFTINKAKSTQVIQNQINQIIRK